MPCWPSQGRTELFLGLAAEHVLDKTGASDCWNRSSLQGLLDGLVPAAAALQTHYLAASKLAHRGAMPPLRAAR